MGGPSIPLEIHPKSVSRDTRHGARANCFGSVLPSFWVPIPCASVLPVSAKDTSSSIMKFCTTPAPSFYRGHEYKLITPVTTTTNRLSPQSQPAAASMLATTGNRQQRSTQDLSIYAEEPYLSCFFRSSGRVATQLEAPGPQKEWDRPLVAQQCKNPPRLSFRKCCRAKQSDDGRG